MSSLKPNSRGVVPGGDKKNFVHSKFQGISRNYDLTNTVLSGGVDRWWRLKTVRKFRWDQPGLILDLCAGTLPLSFALTRRSRHRVVALDLSMNMLRQGRRGIGDSEGTGIRGLVCGEGERLPFADQCFDGVMVGFGVRNLADLEAGLAEVFRVLKPGGRFVILEFSRPGVPIFGRIYLSYLRRLLPRIADRITGDREAYEYLARSIEEFHDREQVAELLRKEGFGRVCFEAVTLGVVTLYVAEKPRVVGN